MPVLTVLGGEAGLGVLQGILSLPKQSAGGRPAYPSLFDKAAVLFRSIILDHPFLDGNKRMAVAASLVFLYMNEEVVCASDGELVARALRVAMGRPGSDWPALSRWFERRCRSQDAIRVAVRTDTLDQLVAGLPGRAPLAKRPLLEAAVALLSEQ